MAAAVTVLCIAALVLLLLVVPLKIELRGSVHNRLDLVLRYKYLFGLICWESKGSRAARVESGAEEDFDWLPRIYHAARTEGLWGRVWRLVKRLWGRVRVENVDVDLFVSLGDDYYTGTIAGYLVPFSLFINSRFGTAINLHPAFQEDLLVEGHINADWRVLPIRVIWPLLLFYFSLPFQQARRRYYA